MSERDELAGPWNLLNDLIADHPMWIGGDGQPLDYSPEREARIHNFIAEASEALAPMLAEAWELGYDARAFPNINDQRNPYCANRKPA